MPTVTRPDGAEIAWYESGAGPPVLLANLGYAHAAVLQGLVDELSRDHRVLSYDPRGTGRSSRHGPYELGVDAGDLVAVLEAAAAVDALVIGNGDGADRAIRAATNRPDLIAAVVLAGNLAAPGGGAGLSNSSSVLDALVTLLETDYKAGLHAMFGPGNPELDQAAQDARVEVTVRECEHEAAVGRIRAWIANDPTAEARALGERLWVLQTETNPWFTATEESRSLLPEANHRRIADGPMSRPDETAAIVRELTRIAAR